MSRTYHHGERARAKYFNEPMNRWWYLRGEAPTPPKRKRYAQNGEWMRTPGWWVHEMMEVKYRAKARMILASVRGGTEDVILPQARKPHIYYW